MRKFIPMPIIFLLFTITSIAFAHYEHFTIPKANITIDGNIDDWNNIQPVFEDDVNDQDKNADYDGTDLHKFYLTKDDTFLYIMMTLYDGDPGAKTGFTIQYGFQANQSPREYDSSGDRLAKAVIQDGKWSAGVYLRGENYDTANYSSRFVGAGSNFIEWKVYLEDMGTLNGRYVRVYIHAWEDGKNAEEYPVSDDNLEYIHIVDEDAATTTPTPTTPTPRPITTPTPTWTPTPSPTPKASPTPAGTGIIYGSVVDEEWVLFGGVSVSLTGTNDYSESTETDKEGYYEFTGLAAGDYTLTYEKDGYQTKTQEVSLEEGETLELETIIMEQTEKGSISGYIVTINGDTVESVKLKLKGIRTKAIKIESTDADGFFEFADLEADDYMITATKKRYRSARKTVTIEEGDATEIEIEMRKTSRRRALTSKQQTQDCRL